MVECVTLIVIKAAKINTINHAVITWRFISFGTCAITSPTETTVPTYLLLHISVMYLRTFSGAINT
jgi:hypothetical protein